MTRSPDQYQSMPVGVVVRRTPGVTRWQKWAWRAVAVLPGAAPADWKVLREEGDVCEFHAATLKLELFAGESEAYLTTVSDKEPAVYVVMRAAVDTDRPLDAFLITASPFEAQDYTDNGEDIVEKIPMPKGLIAWVREFAMTHYEEEAFIKRRRDRKDINGTEAGVGDPRISQMTDVYRAPSRKGDAA